MWRRFSRTRIRFCAFCGILSDIALVLTVRRCSFTFSSHISIFFWSWSCFDFSSSISPKHLSKQKRKHEELGLQKSMQKYKIYTSVKQNLKHETIKICISHTVNNKIQTGCKHFFKHQTTIKRYVKYFHRFLQVVFVFQRHDFYLQPVSFCFEPRSSLLKARFFLVLAIRSLL